MCGVWCNSWGGEFSVIWADWLVIGGVFAVALGVVFVRRVFQPRVYTVEVARRNWKRYNRSEVR